MFTSLINCVSFFLKYEQYIKSREAMLTCYYKEITFVSILELAVSFIH